MKSGWKLLQYSYWDLRSRYFWDNFVKSYNNVLVWSSIPKDGVRQINIIQTKQIA